MKKSVFLMLVLLFITIQKIYSSSIEIINLPVGSITGVAGEGTVVDNNAFNVISNPSMLLLNNKNYFLEYSRLFYFAQTSCDSVGLQIGPAGIGVVINRFSSGEIEIRDIDGVKTNESFEYNILSINTGFSTLLTSFDKNGNLYGGICGYMLWERINFDKKFYGGNVGLLYNYSSDTKLLKTFRAGGVIKGINIVKNLAYHVGLLVQIGTVSIVSGYENRFSSVDFGKTKIGMLFDFAIPNFEPNTIKFSVGYSFSTNKLSNSITSGISVKIENIILGYSLVLHEYLGNNYSVWLSLEL
ncbi:MAG: hypothetical protein NZ839_04625 [Endomicrobia bacterium]|nr:hypothetical protein [Endomicrobiia bacterium]